MDHAEGLNLVPEELVRVYCDISRDAEMKLRLRCIQLQEQDGRKYTRKQYLEKLILDDVGKVKGASFKEVRRRKQGGYALFSVLAVVVVVLVLAIIAATTREQHLFDQECVKLGGVPVHLSGGSRLCLSPDAVKTPAS